MYNEAELPHSLTVQLCDEAGNPTPEQGVRIQMARDAGVKLVPSPGAVKSNKEGQASFGRISVQGKTILKWF